jgi:hypothetical protein
MSGRGTDHPEIKEFEMRAIRKTSPFVLALSIAAPLAAQAPKGAPQTYGTAAVSYVSIPAEAFFPRSSLWPYASDAGRWSSGCAGVCFAAPIQLPSGAKIVYLELDFYDTNATEPVQGRLVECNSLGQNCTDHPAAGAGPADCLLPGNICSGTAFAGGAFSQSATLVPDNMTVDNLNKSYRLLAGGGTFDATNQVRGMIVGYVLQVSPPPASASFNDVPTDHPFFQFIEALKASGITGGCQANPPLYCPDAPLTRGQMAVFLAKALGLQWP